MNRFEYIKCFWKYIDDETPVLLFYEIDTENERYATRMTEVFSDKRAIPVIENGFDFITEAPVPTTDEINKDPQFNAVIISKEEFENAYISEEYAGELGFPISDLTDRRIPPTKETESIFHMFFDEVPKSCQHINTSRGDCDFRETIIAETEAGIRRVIKLADNDFTFPEKIKVWQKTVSEYRSLGYYCPKILCDKTGGFPFVMYNGHKCTAYAEEYSRFASLADRNSEEKTRDDHIYESCKKDIWCMTARIAAKYFDYTDYPSAYCLFETFCPSDKTDEVLENALKWKEYADTLPARFGQQVQRIWRLWTNNRALLETIYKKLPTSVFQADLNTTNILVDESGKFVGVYDFNLCGKDVFLNYLMRENLDVDFEKEIHKICDTLKVSSEYYHFSDLEKESVLMIYRCVKPLWYNKIERLKELQGDNEATKAFLDKTEFYLTAHIDFKAYM